MKKLMGLIIAGLLISNLALNAQDVWYCVAQQPSTDSARHWARPTIEGASSVGADMKVVKDKNRFAYICQKITLNPNKYGVPQEVYSEKGKSTLLIGRDGRVILDILEKDTGFPGLGTEQFLYVGDFGRDGATLIDAYKVKPTRNNIMITEKERKQGFRPAAHFETSTLQ